MAINRCGQDGLRRACAAAESGCEQLTGHSAAVFEYTHEKDEDGKDKLVPPAATAGDYIHLAWASIAAAYLKQGDKQPPLTLANVLCDTTPDEVKQLIVKVIELRNKWYEVPEVAAKDQDAPQPEDGEKPKNA